MFKGLANLAQIMKQAQEAQARMGELKERLGRLTVEGAAGGGLVKVEMNGHQEVLGCRIDESLLRPEDREMVEDLVVAATNEALRKVKEAAAGEFSQLAGGIDLGAMKDMLGGLGGT
jgi:DNA-binding YbaB/EbfC family protein